MTNCKTEITAHLSCQTQAKEAEKNSISFYG